MRRLSSRRKGLAPRGLSPAAFDQLDPVTVRILHEAEPRPSFADAVRLALRLDSRVLQPRKGRVEVVDADRDVAVARPLLVGASVMVERQLELLFLARSTEEIVRRLELAVADDRCLTPEFEAQR